MSRRTRLPSEDAIEADVAILVGSGIFDENYYRAAVGLSSSEDAARHYLLNGWMAGIEPSGGFEGAFLAPYFEMARSVGPPAITYVMFRAAGWAVYATHAHAELVAKIVRASDLFDAEQYRLRMGPKGQILDAALHYVLVGERSGMAPSVRFDPTYYGERNPDVASAGVCFLVHYIKTRSERRPPTFTRGERSFPRIRRDLLQKKKRSSSLATRHPARARPWSPSISRSVFVRNTILLRCCCAAEA